jgi:hypothetical protein
MTAINTLFKSIFSLFSLTPIFSVVATNEMPQVEADSEQVYFANLASLSEEEREKQLLMHEWYAHLAERQGIYEAERHAEAYRRTGDRQHKF